MINYHINDKRESKYSVLVRFSEKSNSNLNTIKKYEFFLVGKHNITYKLNFDIQDQNSIKFCMNSHCDIYFYIIRKEFSITHSKNFRMKSLNRKMKI